ncbi:hypothetical protein K439DRAFT_1623538 [Ramaria rubella]|nr:hypothetical protein K439DRAFT_1623538 [Ramaria rubella]
MDSSTTIMASSLFTTSSNTPLCHIPADDITIITPTMLPAQAESSSDLCPAAAIVGLEKLLHDMNMLSYRVHDQIQATLVSETTTDANYARYICDYEYWWTNNEAQLCNDSPSHIPIPPFPVTAGKVVLFLDYELKRPKRKHGNSNESMEGTTVGSLVICGARLIFHFAAMTESKEQKPLSNIMSQNTYTVDELIDISKWCLTEPHTRNGLITYLWDHSMHLMCTATAFHGDNARELGLSDLFIRDVPNVHADSLNIYIMTWSLRILCNNGKHNQSGKVEEQGMIQHHIPALCAIGALAMHFFTLFHMARQPLALEPDFSQAAQEAGFGKYSCREWYDYKTYFAADISQPMSYMNHANRIKLMHEKNNVAISKVTHAGCIWSALIMHQYGSSVSAAKAIGKWSAAEAFSNCYD